MTPPALVVAWCGLFAAVLSGCVLGVFFHRADWLGGYGSWRRRLLRLGHVAWFGLGMVVLAYALSLPHARAGSLVEVAGWSLIVALATMAPCCWLAAWRPAWRAAFALPVGAAAIGIALFIGAGLLPAVGAGGGR